MSVQIETSRAQAAELALGTLIASVQSNANNAALLASQGLLASQSTNISQNTMAIAALQSGYQSQGLSNTSVTSSIIALQSSSTAASTATSTEVARAQNAESTLAQLIATNASNINSAATGAFISGCNNFAGQIVAVENARALAAESLLESAGIVLQFNVSSIVQTANSEITRAKAAELVLTNTIAAQAILITALQSSLASLSQNNVQAQLNTLNQQMTAANAQITSTKQVVANFFDSNTGNLSCNRLNFYASNFSIYPYQRSDVGSSGRDLAIIWDDGTRIGNGQIFGMYIGSDGRCFMEDNGGVHQVKG